MIRTILLIIVLCFAYSLKASDNTFENANELYEKGSYQDALGIYEKLETDNKSWKLYYNMGNSCFKLKKYLQAKIYYLKAGKLNPVNEDIKFNIRITNRYFKDKIPEEKIDFIAGLIKKINVSISLDKISYLLILSIILLNVSIITFVFKKIAKRVFVYAGTICFVILSLITTYHFYRVDLETARATGVVINDSVSLYSGPGSENTALFEVNSGLKLRISGESSDWYQVSASDDIAGWISAEDMEKL